VVVCTCKSSKYVMLLLFQCYPISSHRWVGECCRESAVHSTIGAVTYQSRSLTPATRTRARAATAVAGRNSDNVDGLEPRVLQIVMISVMRGRMDPARGGEAWTGCATTANAR
jgi:hypothetical protein